MARKQVGLKFEEEDLVRWDAWAEERKLTRTELFELALGRLTGERVDARADAPEQLRRKLDTYPALAQDDPERRQAAVTDRNEAIARGVRPPESGTFGKGVPDKT